MVFVARKKIENITWDDKRDKKSILPETCEPVRDSSEKTMVVRLMLSRKKTNRLHLTKTDHVLTILALAEVNKPCSFGGTKFVFSLLLHVRTVQFTRFSHEGSALIGSPRRKCYVIGPTPQTPSVLHDLRADLSSIIRKR